jgi:predicted nucleotidyltransferase
LEENSLKDLNNEYAALIKEYLDIIKSRVTGVLLFGSVSRHEEMPFPQSDIDMIVVAKDLPSDFYEELNMSGKSRTAHLFYRASG